MLARAACTRSSSAAMSLTASATCCFCFAHRLPPSTLSGGLPWNPPMYFCTRSICEAGTCSIAFWANSSVR